MHCCAKLYKVMSVYSCFRDQWYILHICRIQHSLHIIHNCVFYSTNYGRLGCYRSQDWRACAPQSRPLVPKRSHFRSHHVKRRLFRHSNQHMEPRQGSTLHYTLSGWRWQSQHGLPCFEIGKDSAWQCWRVGQVCSAFCASR